MLPGAAAGRPAVAGTGVSMAGLRGTPAIQSVEQSLFNASRPVSAVASSSSLTANAATGVFSGMDSELVMETGEPVPRLVFGGVPSFQEAKEATAELKEVLEELYPSLNTSSEYETSLIPAISPPLKAEEVENRSRSSNPGHENVLQAFRLLHIPQVQNVVASVVSDPIVHKAMFNNAAVQQYIRANMTSSDSCENEENVTQVGESGAGVAEKLRNMKDSVIRMVTNIPIHLPNIFGSSDAEGSSGSDHKENTQCPPKRDKSASGFVEKLRSLKNSVVEMATQIPNYLPNVFGSSAAEKIVSGSDHKENTQSSPTDWSLGTSLTGLAIMVIMVVLFKRV